MCLCLRVYACMCHSEYLTEYRYIVERKQTAVFVSRKHLPQMYSTKNAQKYINSRGKISSSCGRIAKSRFLIYCASSVLSIYKQFSLKITVINKSLMSQIVIKLSKNTLLVTKAVLLQNSILLSFCRLLIYSCILTLFLYMGCLFKKNNTVLWLSIIYPST